MITFLRVSIDSIGRWQAVRFSTATFRLSSRLRGTLSLRRLQSGDSATFDVDHGGFSDSWKAEIIYANAYWDAPSVGADFDFVLNSQSDNDWTKQTNYYTTRVAVTEFAYNGSTCHLNEVDVWFNTRYSFDACVDDCPSGTYDIRSVAIHEFGHWLVLDHVPWNRPWDWDCVMYDEHGTDYTLCGHDIAGIIEIYGAD